MQSLNKKNYEKYFRNVRVAVETTENERYDMPRACMTFYV